MRFSGRLRWARKNGFSTILWVGLLAFIAYRAWPQVAAAFGVPSANAMAPAFAVTTLDGRTVSLDALRGQVVLVNFWATWCPPCRVEMPGFQRVFDAKKAQGFTIIGVATDIGASGKVREFIADRGITYPVAMATRDVERGFGDPNMLPTSFLIDREGRIRNEVRGIFTSVALSNAVDRLLAEPKQGSAAR